jgi:hypothetical protein
MRLPILILMFDYLFMPVDSFYQTDQFGQMTFTAPSGWKVVKFHGGVALLSSPLTIKEHTRHFCRGEHWLDGCDRKSKIYA